ncbi:MAG: VOC family protein [Sphingomonadales bacterium]
MSKMIFINIPVTDLARSTAFYESVGAVRNAQFSDETASSMVFSDAIHVMLLTHEKFSFFSPRRIPDAHETAQMLLCISADSREDVDQMVARADQGGGTADPCALQDHGFMYGRSFEDPDGHIWEVMWMDVAGFSDAQAEAAQ